MRGLGRPTGDPTASKGQPVPPADPWGCLSAACNFRVFPVLLPLPKHVGAGCAEQTLDKPQPAMLPPSLLPAQLPKCFPHVCPFGLAAPASDAQHHCPHLCRGGNCGMENALSLFPVPLSPCLSFTACKTGPSKGLQSPGAERGLAMETRTSLPLSLFAPAISMDRPGAKGMGLSGWRCLAPL